MSGCGVIASAGAVGIGCLCYEVVVAEYFVD